jgi:hypothetical protein
MEGEMGGIKGEVEEEGFRGAAGLGEEVEGVIGKGVGGIEGAWLAVFGGGIGAGGAILGPARVIGFFLPAGIKASEHPVEFVEAAVGGFDVELVVEVPFADHESVVTGGAEDFGESHGVGLESATIAGELRSAVVGHRANAGLVGVEPGEERGTGGTAPGGVIELRETEAVIGEGIEGWGLDFAAVTAEVRPTEVVGEDEEDIRSGWRGGRGEGMQTREAGQQGKKEGGQGGGCGCRFHRRRNMTRAV